jgi:hypothetical protein
MSNRIDTRDLIEEADELEQDPSSHGNLSASEVQERVTAIRSLISELGHNAEYGMVMVPRDEFEDYAREFAADIGAIDSEANWPANHIDWSGAAKQLSVDFHSVSFDGTNYYAR